MAEWSVTVTTDWHPTQRGVEVSPRRAVSAEPGGSVVGYSTTLDRDVSTARAVFVAVVSAVIMAGAIRARE
jgi:hypothetical protein